MVSVMENKRNIEIKVHDNGCGIAKEYLEHLFGPFLPSNGNQK